jgi:hypothetical protein
MHLMLKALIVLYQMGLNAMALPQVMLPTLRVVAVILLALALTQKV